MIGCFVELLYTEEMPDPLAGQKGTIVRAMGYEGHYEVELTTGRKVRRYWEYMREIESLDG